MRDSGEVLELVITNDASGQSILSFNLTGYSRERSYNLTVSLSSSAGTVTVLYTLSSKWKIHASTGYRPGLIQGALCDIIALTITAVSSFLDSCDAVSLTLSTSLLLKSMVGILLCLGALI